MKNELMPHQEEMALFPVKEVEVNGVQMGVLNDGTPFLSLRGFSPSLRRRPHHPASVNYQLAYRKK